MNTNLVLLQIILFIYRANSESPWKAIKNCLSANHPLVCLKEEAVEVLDESINSTQPVSVFDLFEIVKDPEYKPKIIDGNLPENATLRNERLNNVLYEKFDELVNSRTVRLGVDSVSEGRKKDGGGGGGKGKMGMAMMMVGMAMAGMLGKMMMGKVAFLAGAALITAKLALFLSAIVALKKLSSGGGGGGGETKHIVYTAAQPDFGHSHGDGGGGGYGGGGWHRSLNALHEDPHTIIYKAHVPEETNYSV